MKDDIEIPWLGIILATGAVLLVVFLLHLGGLSIFKVFGPEYEKTRRETWEQSPSFIHGKQQYLTRLYGEWLQADLEHKGAICTVARQEAATIDPNDVPQTLIDWECVK